MNRIVGPAIAAAIVGSFGTGVWMYFEGFFGTGQPAGDAVPVVEPLPDPVRQRPEDPGGYRADSRGISLMGDDDSGPTGGAERLLPSHEEPVTGNRADIVAPPPEPEAQSDPGAEAEPNVAGAPPGPAAEPLTLPERRHPRSTWKASIQLLAVRSRDRAVVEARRLLAAHPDVFGNLDFRVREFKVSEEERVQRLQAGPFATRKDAGDVCNVLGDRGVPCFVAKGQ